MSGSSSQFLANVNNQREMLDISLPGRGSSSKSAGIERQFDQLVDLLAVDSAADRIPTEAQPLEQAIAQTHSQFCAQERSTQPVELSIVMPCLDEADTVGNCVLKARYAIEKLGIAGEVIVADNGSRDDSIEIAETLGARVVHVSNRGYGAALMAGIEASHGRYIIMADADDSYDFTDSHKFYRKLTEGADLVQGCRLPQGGGRIMPGAMPTLHQWGNPILTWMVRKMFRAPVHDVYCGMRGFRRDLYNRLDLRCTGMEFATEMIIKSRLFDARISEIPITLYPDGRRTRGPHLRTFRDGWRTLRFFMLQSPRWTFLVPGVSSVLYGLGGCLLASSGASLFGIQFDAHTMLVSMLAILVGAQMVWCAVLAKTFAGSEGLLPRDRRLDRLSKIFTLEMCLTVSVGLALAGSAIVSWQAWDWASRGFGQLDYSQTMRTLIPAVGAVALGVQAAASSFLLSVLRLARK